MSHSKNRKIKDIDDKIRCAANKKDVVREMKIRAGDAKPVKENTSAKKTNQSIPQKSSNKEDLIKHWPFKNIIPVCEVSDGMLLIYSRVNHKFYIIKANDIKYPLLLQMGGQEVFDRVYRRTENKTDRRNLSFDDVRDALVLLCSKLQMGSAKWFGQGIHRLTDDRMLLLSGGEALIYDGNSVTAYNQPILDGKLVEYDGGRGWLNLTALKTKLQTMSAEKGKQIINELLKLFGQWRFAEGDDDLEYFVAAFLALVVHNCWLFKAHCYISGRAGCGKTILLTIIQRLLGSGIARRREGSILSSAGLAQEAGHDAAIFLIDEFERSKNRDEILMLARSTGRGGTVGAKGTANQKAILVEINAALFLCSIDRALTEEAEQDRYILFDLRKDNTRMPFIPPEDSLTDFRHDVFAFCLWASFQALCLIKTVGLIPGLQGRTFEAYSPGLAMLTIGMGGDVEVFRALLTRIAEKRRQVNGAGISDEQRLLDDILSLRLRVSIEVGLGVDEKTKYVARTVGQLLESHDELHARELEAHGIKQCDDGVFLVPEMLKGQLRGTEWEQRGLKTYLKRLNGAQEKQRRCGGGNGREGILIPVALVSGG
ncbi:MAG: hypothetical protein CVU54_14385 [Deltaproteobacteria bacterium HGW-Deltaproteobacteria-12]|nr:MAG: hypothetical protein CVU54_14385 [Deltaproteobacteria bacterium HGW-Deltaproteobacteria-12]